MRYHSAVPDQKSIWRVTTRPLFSCSKCWVTQRQLKGGMALASRASQEDAPWSISNYYTKKLSRDTNELGEIIQHHEFIAGPIGWNAQAKMDLAIQAISRDTGMPMEQLSERVSSLLVVLPDVDSKLATMKQADLVKLAHKVDDIAAKLLLLKKAFPEANVSQLAVDCRHMLLLDVQQFREAVSQVQLLLSDAANPSAILTAAPMLLDPAVLRSVLDEMQRLFGAPPVMLLQQNPVLAFSCQSLQQQARGDRDADYLGDIFSVGKR